MKSMRVWFATSAALLASCTINKYYVAPPPPAAAPPVAIASTPPNEPPLEHVSTPVEPAPAAAPTPVALDPDIGRLGRRHTEQEVAAADAYLASRFTVAKQFLIANKARYDLYTSYLGRVGHPGELAPIVEAPGGGFYLALDRNVEREQFISRPVLLRLDANGAVMWSLDLPTERRFPTYEVKGCVVAPDGSVVVQTTPFKGRGTQPHAALLAKVTSNGRLVWGMQVPESRDIYGPFPQDLSIDGDGTLRLAGHAAYQREHAKSPDTGDAHRTWQGTVTANGRFVSAALGDYLSVARQEPVARRVFSFWFDLYLPAA